MADVPLQHNGKETTGDVQKRRFISFQNVYPEAHASKHGATLEDKGTKVQILH